MEIQSNSLPSILKGAILISFGIIVVAGLTLFGAEPRNWVETAMLECSKPVEYWELHSSTLVCGTEWEQDCSGLVSGDRIEVVQERCKVISGGMSGRMRLAAGLRLDLNLATVEDLRLLKGVGHKTAQAIIEFRGTLGYFKSVDSLLAVRGLGETRVAKLRPFLSVDPGHAQKQLN